MHRPKLLSRPVAALLLAGLLALAPGVQAQVVGTVGDLTGVLVVRRAEGARLLAAQSQLRQGDTLATGPDAWARLRFVDGAELVLQPDSRLVLTRYAYDAGQPQGDRVEIALEQGGFQSTAGLIGQRSKDATLVTTPAGNLKGSATMTVSLQQP